MTKGKVKWFDDKKGYGFINADEEPDQDVFVHYSSIDEEGYRKLCEGEPVEFNLEITERGPVANDVKKMNQKEK